MARSLSVKVPTSSLIKLVEDKIAEIDKAIANYPDEFEKYEKATDKYKKDVAKFISKFVADNASKIGYDYNSVINISTNYNGRVELRFDADKIANFPKAPEAPKKPNETRWFGREHATQREMLDKTLRVLKLTAQEEVNASTYSSVMDLL
jgi:hypothetical protein